MFLVPFTRTTNELARSFDRLFDDSFDRFFAPATTPAADAPHSPALDITETDRVYTVKLDLPGVTKEDVQVDIDGRRISVQAKTQRTEEKKDGDRVVYRERAMTSFARTFTLPIEVDQVESGAKLDNGVLTLTLPKRVGRNAARVTVS
jgi:HSP20 family protein